MPATVPLASLCGEGAGVILVLCGAALLLAKVLGLVLGLLLLGLEVIGVEVPLDVDSGLGVTEVEDAAVALPDGRLEMGDEGLAEPAARIRYGIGSRGRIMHTITSSR